MVILQYRAELGIYESPVKHPKSFAEERDEVVQKLLTILESIPLNIIGACFLVRLTATDLSREYSMAGWQGALRGIDAVRRDWDRVSDSRTQQNAQIPL